MSTDGKSDKAAPGKTSEESSATESKAKAEKTGAPNAEQDSKKRKWTAIWVGTLVFLALVGSLTAWLQGKSSRQPEVDELTTERDECRDDKSALENTVSELEDKIEVLEARRQIARAANELGAQNFGSAQEALDVASSTLRGHGHDVFADRLDEVATTPTDDVTGPRDTIRAIGHDLDGALGD